MRASHVAQELRTSLRALLRRPTFSLTVVATMALGIGAVTTVISVVSALLLRPLPFPNADRLAAIWPSQTLANREVMALRDRATSYTEIAAFSPGWLMGLTSTPTPHQVNAARVSGNFFRMLGAHAAIGQTFGLDAEVPGNERVAVLSHSLWQSAFDADPAIVGRAITLEGVQFVVLGILPPGFRIMDAEADLWTPLAMDRAAMTWAGSTARAYGRLRPGVTLEAASVELGVLAAAMAAEFQLPPDWTRGTTVTGLKDNMVGGTRPILMVLLAAVTLLLLIAVANIANLFLVRTSERRQELAVRASLGADRSAIARLLLGECVLLGAAGGAVGMVLAYGGVALLHVILPANLPRIDEITVDARVLAGAALATAIAILLFGLLPALRGARTDPASRIRGGRGVAGGGGRTRSILVAAEVGLALVLSIGAALMARTMVALDQVDRGLRSEHLLTMRMEPGGFDSDAARLAWWHRLLDEVRAVPGVSGAATILHLPTSGRSWKGTLEIEGRPAAPGQAPARVAWQSISPGWFSVSGVPLLAGRAFENTDGPGASLVIVVNSALAARFFPGNDAVGKRIKAGNATRNQWATIVGVVGSVRHDSLNAPPQPEVYVPFDQRPVGATSLVVRTVADPEAVFPALRQRIWAVNASVPISHVLTMDELYSGSLQRQRMILVLMAVFAGVGLLLSAIGTYGVVAYGVRQRTREIGVRIALGADTASIGRLVVGQGVRYALAGVTAGIPAALLLGRLMRGMVYGVPTTDPLSFALAPLILLAVAAGASWFPARKAAATEPSSVLRE